MANEPAQKELRGSETAYGPIRSFPSISLSAVLAGSVSAADRPWSEPSTLGIAALVIRVVERWDAFNQW